MNKFLHYISLIRHGKFNCLFNGHNFAFKKTGTSVTSMCVRVCSKCNGEAINDCLWKTQ